MNEELYQRLGVEKTATSDQIKAGYRRAAQIHHPDHGGDPDAFVALVMAYNTLMDPKLREEYDLTGVYGDEGPMVIQKRIIESLAALFEVVLERLDRPVENADIIERMKMETRRVVEKNQQRKSELVPLLKLLHQARGRIKRVGEGENIFLEIADRKIEELAAELAHVNLILDDSARMIDELSNHKSVFETIRTFQMGAYPVPNATNPGGFFGSFPIRY